MNKSSKELIQIAIDKNKYLAQMKGALANFNREISKEEGLDVAMVLACLIDNYNFMSVLKKAAVNIGDNIYVCFNAENFFSYYSLWKKEIGMLVIKGIVKNGHITVQGDPSSDEFLYFINKKETDKIPL